MSLNVLTSEKERNYHWQSASKPALNKCHYRLPPLALNNVHHHHRLNHHYYHQHHHRPRRRHLSAESSPPPPWTRRSSEASRSTFSVASSWHAGDKASLLGTATESFGGFRGGRLASPSTSLTSSGYLKSTSPYSTRLCANKGYKTSQGLKAPSLILTCDTFRKMSSSSSGGPRNASLESTAANNNNTSTAAAREVKQYLNKTLFPRPSSTLHGYASLYQRLKKLPGSHRKARQRGKTAPPLDASGVNKAPGMISGRQFEETTPPTTESELDDFEDPLEVPLRTPPRVEIHIYVPSGSPLSSTSTHLDEESLSHHFTS